MRELEAAAGASDRMCRALEEMRAFAVHGEEDAVAMPVIVRVTRLLEQRLGSDDAEAPQELREAGMALLFAFRDALSVS